MDARERPGESRQFRNWAVSLFILLPLALVAAGCTPKTEPITQVERKAAKPRAVKSADGILQAMLRVYQETEAYGDEALLHLSYVLDGQRHRDSASISVRFERPHRVRVNAYQVDIACDGRQLVAHISDENSNDIDHQVLVRQAPSRLSLDNLLDDALLADVISSGLGRIPVQLELLLSDKPLEGFFAADVKRKLLDPQQLHGTKCHRVAVTTDEGDFVLWIDQDSQLLRRLEYPPSVLLATLPAEQLPADVQLAAEFDGARLKLTSADERAFAFAAPTAARQVRYFVKPPQPLPSNLFGQQTGAFQFTSLDGSSWSSALAKNKIAVIHFYVDHPSCEASLKQWEQVRLQYLNRDDVVFLAVCVEPASVTAEVIREVLRRWNVASPVVRDLQAAGRDVFGIAALPAIVILDREQVVQAFEITYNPDLAQQLPTAIDQLLAGQNLAAHVLAQFHNDTSEYYHILAAAGAPANVTEPSARSVPVRWQVTQLWQAPLHQPGNMLLVQPQPDPARLYVLEEGRIVLELDENGRSLGTHILPIPESEYVTHLRAAADGRAFVAFSLGGRRAYWLDEDWKLVCSAPDSQLRHSGIRDAVFLPAGEQQCLCIAASGAGVIATAANGKSQWHLQQPHMQSLAVDHSGRLIAADASGRVMGIHADGSEIPIADKQGNGLFRVWSMQTAPGEDGAALLGLSYRADGARIVYGLDNRFQALWEYELPGDPFHSPADFAAHGMLDDSGYAHWVLASADGAVHLVSADGRHHDYFFAGHHVSGLQVWHGDERSTLILSGDNAVTAWQLRPLDSSPVTTEAPADREVRGPTLTAPIRSAQKSR